MSGEPSGQPSEGPKQEEQGQEEALFTGPPPPPPETATEADAPDDAQTGIDTFTYDDALIFAILQEGLPGFFRVRDKGIRKEHLRDAAQTIFGLFEDFTKKSRLPTLTEIQVATGATVVMPDEPFDIDLFGDKIVARALKMRLKNGLAPVVTGYQQDPWAARDRLVEVVRDTAWATGGVSSYTDPSTSLSVVGDYEKARDSCGALLGLSSPWPNVDSRSLGLQNGELTVILAKRKVGKCIAEGTLIRDPETGALTPIETVVRHQFQSVTTWSDDDALHTTKPSAYLDQGEQDCVRVKFRSGRSLTLTPNHPLLTPRGWEKVEDLKVGYHVAAARFIEEPLMPAPMIGAKITMLGGMLAEGGCTKPSTPTFTSSVPEIVDVMRDCADLFDAKLKPAKGDAGTYYLVSTRGSRNLVVEFLDSMGLMGKKSVEKSLPPAVFSQPDDRICSLLGIMWSCDGCVDKHGRVSYSTGSETLALQVQHLLLRFGVTTHIRTMPRQTKDGPRDYYEVVVHREHIEAFKENVRLVGPKAERLKTIRFQGRSRIGWLRNEEIRDLVYAEIDAQPDLLQDIGSELGYDFKFQKGHIFDSVSGRVRRKVFAAFCDVYDSPLKWLLRDELWWDAIVSIEPVGKRRTFDFSIPETHCFVANGLIVHNSWLVFKWCQHILRTDLQPGESILLVSMEMPIPLCWRRLAAIDLNLCYSDLRAGRLTTPAENRLYKWSDEMKNPDPLKPRLYVIGPNMVRDVADIAAKTAELNPRLVAIDGFYILGRDRRMGMWERTLQNVSEIKLDLCAQLDVPVLGTTQIKGSKDKDSLDFSADDAAYAKAIGDYADAMRGLGMNGRMEMAGERAFQGMETREFQPVDLLIRFDLNHMRFDEMHIIDGTTTDFDGPVPPKKDKKQMQANVKIAGSEVGF